MTASAATATGKPAARTRTDPRLDRTPVRRERVSLEYRRRLERDAASLEAASFPEALIGVPFN
jgi:hypothetical protein